MLGTKFKHSFNRKIQNIPHSIVFQEIWHNYNNYCSQETVLFIFLIVSHLALLLIWRYLQSFHSFYITFIMWVTIIFYFSCKYLRYRFYYIVLMQGCNWRWNFDFWCNSFTIWAARSKNCWYKARYFRAANAHCFFIYPFLWTNKYVLLIICR